LPEVRQTLLLTLFKNGKITFRKLQETSQVSPRIVNRYLKTLVNEKLVHETGRKGWKQGKRLWYSLTKKGRAECISLTINELNETLKVVQEIGIRILSEPSLMDEFREKSRQALFETKITESMSVDERVRVVVAEMNRIYGPLIQSYRAMHKLMVQLVFPKVVDDYEFFIGFTRKGGIHMIPRATLERQGFEVP
jgi:predicted ArsR family transcriptional regulator